MKPKFLTLLLFAVVAALAQQTHLDFMNNGVALFPGCTDTQLRYDCFVQGIGTVVADSVNGYHKVHPFAEDKLQVVLTVVSKESGEVMLLSAKTANTALRDIAEAAISRLPKAIPIFSPQGYPVAASTGFVLVLKKDASGLFVQEYTSKVAEWAAKPNPMPMPIIDAAFPGCKDSKSFGNCFEQQCNQWFVPKLSAVAASEIKKGVVIKVTVNEIGKLHSYEVFTASASLKTEAETIMKSFPTVTPSTVNGQPYMATYVFPLNIK